MTDSFGTCTHSVFDDERFDGDAGVDRSFCVVVMLRCDDWGRFEGDAPAFARATGMVAEWVEEHFVALERRCVVARYSAPGRVRRVGEVLGWDDLVGHVDRKQFPSKRGRALYPDRNGYYQPSRRERGDGTAEPSEPGDVANRVGDGTRKRRGSGVAEPRKSGGGNVATPRKESGAEAASSAPSAQASKATKPSDAKASDKRPKNPSKTPQDSIEQGPEGSWQTSGSGVEALWLKEEMRGEENRKTEASKPRARVHEPPVVHHVADPGQHPARLPQVPSLPEPGPASAAQQVGKTSSPNPATPAAPNKHSASAAQVDPRVADAIKRWQARLDHFVPHAGDHTANVLTVARDFSVEVFLAGVERHIGEDLTLWAKQPIGYLRKRCEWARDDKPKQSSTKPSTPRTAGTPYIAYGSPEYAAFKAER